jgi:hypothetical protein
VYVKNEFSRGTSVFLENSGKQPSVFVSEWTKGGMMAPTKEHAHELIDRMAPGQIAAIVGLLEIMLDPVSRAIANAPIDDEPESEAERQAVAASKAWMAQHPGEGIPFEDILAEFGHSAEELKR